MRILLLTSSYNTMCRNIRTELAWQGHQTFVELALSSEVMTSAVQRYTPDLIVCPMLTARIPEAIWREHTCLIVHPGIKGDRGCSSLDWAIHEQQPEWGVTILEAAAELDAGDIWSSHNFPMRSASKSSIYRDEVVRNGVKGVLEAVQHFQDGKFKAEPLDYSDPNVRGTLHASMKQSDRAIDWAEDSVADIVRKIRCADSNPGVLDTLFNEQYYLYGAFEEDALHGEPGEVIATRNGAICRGAKDGAVWISHLKKKHDDPHATFKLPATLALGEHVSGVPEVPLNLLHTCSSKTFKEIWYEEKNGVGYVYFEFYNGAMSTDQCERLLNAYLAACRRSETKVIVLMGGRDFWSNGIHLNVIEAAQSPGDESMRNLRAMNNLVHAIVTTKSHITVSAIQGSAGAGGVMLALAADHVFVRSGLLLNPFYKSMGGLYGSEFWTYLLPRRVGEERAFQITEACLPVGVAEAQQIGMVDAVYTHEPNSTFRDKIGMVVDKIARSKDFKKQLEQKCRARERDEKHKPLAQYQDEEMEHVRRNFFGPDKAYHQARSDFVRKVTPSETPPHLNRGDATKAADRDAAVRSPRNTERLES